MRFPETIKFYVIQLLSNQAISAAWLFMPNLAKLFGSSESMIGMIGASYGLAVFISSYIFGRRSDIEGSKRYLHFGLLFSSLAFALLYLTRNFSSLLLLYFISGLAVGMYPPTLITYVFGKKVRLGKFTAFGSLGAGIGLLAAGFIAESFALRSVFTYSSILSAVMFFVSITLPEIPKKRHKVPFFPSDLFKKNLPIFLSYFLRHVAANTVWIIYPLFLRGLGISFFWISVLYTINPFAQFIIMYIVTDKIPARKLVALGLFFVSAAFFSMFLSQNIWHIVLVQLMIAASWSFLYVGSLRYVTEGDVRKATTSGLLSSIISLGSIFGPLIGGMISEIIGGYRGNMLIAGIIGASSLLMYEILIRKIKS